MIRRVIRPIRPNGLPKSAQFAQLRMPCNTHVLSSSSPEWQDPVHSSATVTRSDAVARRTRHVLALLPAAALALTALAGCATSTNSGAAPARRWYRSSSRKASSPPAPTCRTSRSSTARATRPSASTSTSSTWSPKKLGVTAGDRRHAVRGHPVGRGPQRRTSATSPRRHDDHRRAQAERSTSPTRTSTPTQALIVKKGSRHQGPRRPQGQEARRAAGDHRRGLREREQGRQRVRGHPVRGPRR